jgi:hypothetical protein
LDNTFFGKFKKAITPTTQGLNSGIQRMFGKYHEPETTPGKYAETIGQAVPSALLMGPASATRGVVGRTGEKLLTSAVIPGVAEETAGQLTDDNPWARAGASMLFGARGTRHPSRANEITSQHLFASGDQKYKMADRINVEYAPQRLARTADALKKRLLVTKQEGMIQHTANVLDEISSRRNPFTARDVENYRQKLLDVATDYTKPKDAAAAWTAINHLGRFMDNIPTSQVVTGTVQDAARVRDLYRRGRQDWGAAKRMEMMEGKMTLGEMNAESAHSAQNAGNSMRQAVKQLVRPNHQGRSLAVKHGFNQAERDEMRGVVRGNFAGNALRDVANSLGKGHGQMINLASLGAAYETGDPRYLGIVLAGRGLNHMANRSTINQTRRLAANIAERSDLAASRGPRTPGNLSQGILTTLARGKMAATPDGYPYIPPEGNE